MPSRAATPAERKCIMNTKERCDIVRAMELLVRSVNNKDYIMTWLRIGVADGDIRPDTTDEDLEYYIEDDSAS